MAMSKDCCGIMGGVTNRRWSTTAGMGLGRGDECWSRMINVGHEGA